jgi:stage V sporulation protein G
MQITEVKVFPVTEEKLKAFVSIVVDGCFMINDIKVIRGKDGLFISMPSRKKKSGDFKDVAHPLNNETRRMIEERVLGEYERVLLERGEQPEVGRRRLRIDDGERGQWSEAEPPDDRLVAASTALPAPEAIAAAGAGEAAPEVAAPAGAGATASAGAREDDEEAKKGKSLEEIQEMHLRDSFWSVS